VRLNYRMPNEFGECVLDTMAGLAFLSAMQYRRAAIVGHSFGGAVAINAGTLSPTVTAVVAVSSQLAGAAKQIHAKLDQDWRGLASDLEALHAIHGDEENVRWLYNDARTLGEARKLLALKAAGIALRAEGEWLSAAVELRATGELVGDISLLWASVAHRQGELGFIFQLSHQGKGYATEAARPMLAYAFDVVGLHRVIGRLEPRNRGSARVLEKLGMRREAHLVENEWVKGEWQSELVYAILAHEWRGGSAGTEPGDDRY